MVHLGDRRRYIGASELAAVSGFSKWKSPRQVWGEKTGEATPGDTFAMAIGRAIEPVVIDELQRRGWQLRATDCAFTLSEHPPIICHPDAVFVDGRPVEIKASGVVCPLRGWGREPPVEYRIQVMAQAVALSRSLGKPITSGTIVAVLGGVGLKTYDVEVDETFMEVVIERAAAFWDFVERRVPPPDDWPTGGQSHEEEPVHVSREIADLAIAYAEAWAEARGAESELAAIRERCDLLRAALLDACGGRDVVVADGAYRVTVKHTVRRTIDQTLLRVQHPDVYEQCTRESVVPSVTVKLSNGGADDQ